MSLSNPTSMTGLLLLVFTGGVAAQDPFDVRNPFAGTKPADATEALDAVPDEEVETDPRVLAVEAWNPGSVEQLVMAVEILVNLKREDAARPYLEQVVAGNPNAATLIQLHRRFGSAMFVRLSLNEELAPEGATLAEAVMSAAELYSASNAHLLEIVTELGDASPDVRRRAMVNLSAAGRPGIVAVMAAMVDTDRASLHPACRAALVGLGDISFDPLLGALESDDAAFVVQVIEVLGSLGDRRACSHLLNPAFSASDDTVRAAAQGALAQLISRLPTESDAAAFLAHRVETVLAERIDDDRTRTVWQWDAVRRLVVAHETSDEVQRLVEAARLARDLDGLSRGEDQVETRRLALALGLAVQKRVGGPWRPISADTGPAYAVAAEAGAEVLEQVLVEAVDRNLVAGAIAAAEILGKVGTDQLVVSRDGRPRPLVQMLRHSSGSLRFAAAQAILELGPTRAFPGSSGVTEVLAEAAGTGVTSRVLIVDPRIDRAQSLAAYLESMGYRCDLARTGRQLVSAAVEADYSFVLADSGISAPGISETLQWLRRDYRTARLPVAILATESTMASAVRYAEAHGHAIAVVRPTSDADLAVDVDRLKAVDGWDAMDSSERRHRALVSLGWLAQLAQSPDKFGFYEVARHEPAIVRAVNTPGLTVAAAPILAATASPTAQRVLVDVTSQPTRSIEDRRAAAAAFDAAVQKNRIQLTTPQILEQYSRYNLTETLDADTQQVMGSILDTIERAAPTSKRQ